MSRLLIQTDEQGRKYIADHFEYTAYVPQLASGATSTSQIQVEADADFVWVRTLYFADIAGAPQTNDDRVIPLVAASITDTGSGRNLQNRALPLAVMGGHEGLGFNLYIPRVFRANSNIQVTMSNYSAATTYDNIFLVFSGYKKFFM